MILMKGRQGVRTQMLSIPNCASESQEIGDFMGVAM